jgi:hypothetical protein
MTNLDKVLPYHVAQVVDIGRKGITACMEVFVFRY